MMSRKRLLMVVMAAAIIIAMSMTAFAGQWQKDEAGWWWQRTDGSFPTSSWKWIDGNGDGTVESYYFDTNGYLLASTTTPDGYTVNENGIWIVNGVVQSRPIHPEIGDEVVDAVTGTAAMNSGAVTDGKSVAQIVLNEELAGMITINGLDKILNRTEVGQGNFGPVYNTEYRGNTLKFSTDMRNNANYISTFTGIASQIFNNIPEQGIEMNAFYDNSGLISNSVGRSIMATTGQSDQTFGLPTGSYRMVWGNSGKRHFEIVVTPGENDTWYIYPNSPAYMN